jgi:phosphoglycolate phosphatase
MSRMGWRAVVLDLDGTLLDTREDIADAMNRVLAGRGFPVHPYESYNRFIGDGAAVLVRRALPADRQDEGTVSACLVSFLADYGDHWDLKTRVYPGIQQMLSGISGLGVRMAVLTNKPEAMALKCAGRYFGAGRFDVVQGQTPEIPKKPDPAGAFLVASRMSVAPGECLYLGDTATDMETAIRAGMFPVGALWGFRPASELRESGAKAMVGAPADLLPLLSDSASRG